MRMDTLLYAPFVMLALAGPASAEGHFSEHLSFHPSGCEQKRECYLDQNFDYVDSNGAGWEARQGDKTDGASIPEWAQSYIGLPFDPNFIRAAVIHDHYCDRHVRPMLRTHWVFYDALKTSRVPERKAKIMYAAILIGGPKWISLIPGKPCALGTICIQSVKDVQLPQGAYTTTADDARGVIARPEQYNKPEIKAAIDEITRMIESNPDAVTENDILTAARNVPENRFFFEHIDGVVINPPQFQTE